jgi:glycosyltransferase involved in cell wall biosynthesis
MRILYLHPNSWTGEYPILRKLRELGQDVCALEERRGLKQGKRHSAEHFREAGDGIATLWYDPGRGWERLLTWPFDRVFRRAFDGRNLVHRMWVIAEALRKFSPDAIVCSDGFSYAIPAAFLRRLGLLKPKLVVSYIGGDILDCPEASYGKRRTPMVSWLIETSLAGIDVMRPVSEYLAEVLRLEGGNPANVRVLPSHLVAPTTALNRVFAERAAIRSELRARYDLSLDAPVVVTLSGNQKGKGLHVLAAGWERIVRGVPGVRWLLCGPRDPWLQTAVLPLLGEKGLLHTVIVAGRLEGEEVFRHLACADLHANPTLCEGLNMVTVEAAAVGTPTVTSDGAGIADWIKRYGAGAVVPRNEVGALADAIIRALNNHDELSRWASNARPMADEFLLERIAPAMLELLGSRTRGSGGR